MKIVIFFVTGVLQNDIFFVTMSIEKHTMRISIIERSVGGEKISQI